MSHNINDLTVLVINRLVALHDHQFTDKNAFKKGVISGLLLGTARLTASTQPADSRLVELLVDCERDLSELLYEANSFMPVGRFCNESMFVSVMYRKSTSSDFYSEGIRLGFNYVMELFDALGGASAVFSLRNLTIECARQKASEIDNITF